MSDSGDLVQKKIKRGRYGWRKGGREVERERDLTPENLQEEDRKLSFIR